MYLNYFVWLHLERNDYSTWYWSEPVGTGWFRPVPTRFQLIPSGSGRNPTGSGRNRLESGRNQSEPLGTNRFRSVPAGHSKVLNPLGVWQLKLLLMVVLLQLNNCWYPWNLTSFLCPILDCQQWNSPFLSADKSNRSIICILRGLIAPSTMWNAMPNRAWRISHTLPRTLNWQLLRVRSFFYGKPLMVSHVRCLQWTCEEQHFLSCYPRLTRGYRNFERIIQSLTVLWCMIPVCFLIVDPGIIISKTLNRSSFRNACWSPQSSCPIGNVHCHCLHCHYGAKQADGQLDSQPH